MKTAVRALMVVVIIDAVVWLVGVPPTLYVALRERGLPEFAGIRLLGGPFEALGLGGLIAAGLVFTAVSGLKFLAAYWLRQGWRDGVVLQLVLLGTSALFWYGFALPLGPLLGLAQLALLAPAWQQLRPR